MGAQVEIALYPGQGLFEPLNHLYVTGHADIGAACTWLGNHQHRIVPRGGGFLLPDFASQVRTTVGWLASGELVSWAERWRELTYTWSSSPFKAMA